MVPCAIFCGLIRKTRKAGALVQGAQGKPVHTFDANGANDRYYVVELLLAINIDHLSIQVSFRFRCSRAIQSS